MKNIEQVRLDSKRHYGFGTESMKEIKICTGCRTPAHSSEAYCGECGTPLPEATLYDMYKSRHKSCPGCGIVVLNQMDYCPQCGIRLNT